MMQGRLPILLVVLAALALLRIVVPPRDEPPSPVAEAVVRVPLPAPAVPESTAREVASADGTESAGPSPVADVPGDAFGVKPPPAPPSAPAAAVVVAARPALIPPAVTGPASPPPPPAPPPPPFQVIGTWDDGGAPGVFLSSPGGVVLARQGATLQAEYQVLAVTAQHISLQQIASKREFTLSAPRPASSQPRP